MRYGSGRYRGDGTPQSFASFVAKEMYRRQKDKLYICSAPRHFPLQQPQMIQTQIRPLNIGHLSRADVRAELGERE